MTAEYRAVAVSLQKGGVGKTTIAINLAERLAARGEDVVLLDLDQQGNATEALGLAESYDSDGEHLGDVFDAESDVGPEDLLEPAAGETAFRVLPSHEDLDVVEREIEAEDGGVARVRTGVVDPLLEAGVDRVVIDAPPSMRGLSDSALVAADGVVVPLLMSDQSVGGLFRMVSQQLQPIWSAGVETDLLAIVPNRLSGDNEEERIIGRIEESERLGPTLVPFGRSEHFDRNGSPGPGIRKRVELKRTVRDGVPLATFDPGSDMIERFDDLADVVVEGGVENV